MNHCYVMRDGGKSRGSDAEEGISHWSSIGGLTWKTNQGRFAANILRKGNIMGSRNWLAGTGGIKNSSDRPSHSLPRFYLR